jgi:hypothetical protein
MSDATWNISELVGEHAMPEEGALHRATVDAEVFGPLGAPDMVAQSLFDAETSEAVDAAVERLLAGK